MERQCRNTFKSTAWFVAALCIGMTTGPAIADDAPAPADAGTLEGAAYRVDIPAHWNGDLVMLMHGYQPVGAPQKTPMAPGNETDIFLGRGYAVAQSAYASQGWAVGDAIADSERLRQHFVARFGAPRHA